VDSVTPDEPRRAPIRWHVATAGGTSAWAARRLPAQAIEAGLVDEYQLFLVPVVVGDGKRSLPDTRVRLELLNERRFRNGTVYLRYRTRR
jgi:dihydrofolate reductase